MMSNNREFVGGAYSPGEFFDVSPRNLPLNREQLLELTLEALVNPSPAVQKAIARFTGKYETEVVKVEYIERPIYSLWQYIKIWWTGEYPAL